MKNRLPIFLLLLLLGHALQAQNKKPQTIPTKPQAIPFGPVFTFGCLVTESMRANLINSQSVSVIDTKLSQLFKPWVLKDKTVSKLLLGVKLNPKLTNYDLSSIKSFSKTYKAYRISDSSEAIMIAMGITKENVENYRYHVVLDDSAEIIHWSKIPRLEMKYGADKPYGFIGKFKYLGKQALVEVVNINDYQIRDGVIFDWRKSFKPVTTNLRIYAAVPTYTGDLKKMDPDFFHPKEIPYKSKQDPLTGEITEISFVADSISQLQLLLREHPTIPYKSHIINDDSSEHPFFMLPFSGALDPEFTLNALPPEPGKYYIEISPDIAGISADQTLRIPVIILPHPPGDKKISVKQLVPFILGALVLITLLFWLYRRRVNIKLARSVQARQNVNLKMRSIRSQLNPHFMFNALTSIQNLVNKKDMEGANHYLSRFANLTRKVLNTGEKELISLEDELKILDDYLQMEQLRFGFRYQINTDAGINVANIEVPSMLLQPFAENAVKHGVADLRERGEINVAIRKNNTDLNLIITDNGTGFDQITQARKEGSFGLKLSEERIQLLNEIYKDQPALLNIQSGDTGTTVTLTLTNWIS